MILLESFSVRQKNGRLKYFLKLECKCGKVFVTRQDANTKSCGCIRNELNRTRRLGKPALNRHRKAERLIEVTQNQVYKGHSYNDGDISLEKFVELSQKNCYYCNAHPSNRRHIGRKADGTHRNKQKRKAKDGSFYYTKVWASDFGEEAAFIYNGLDRIDSTKKHTLSNVVPCCFICNRAKLNHTQQDFINWIERVYKWNFQKKD